MTYNIHPIFVHFPIALLVLYSVIKMLPLRRWIPSVSWQDVERILLLFGVLGAFSGLATGETAEYISRPNRQVVEAHAFFASLATWLYGALLAGEVATLYNRSALAQRFTIIRPVMNILERILCQEVVVGVLVIVALVAITVTGLLGGVMVYGTSADPIAKTVLDILGISF